MLRLHENGRRIGSMPSLRRKNKKRALRSRHKSVEMGFGCNDIIQYSVTGIPFHVLRHHSQNRRLLYFLVDDCLSALGLYSNDFRICQGTVYQDTHAVHISSFSWIGEFIVSPDIFLDSGDISSFLKMFFHHRWTQYTVRSKQRPYGFLSFGTVHNDVAI